MKKVLILVMVFAIAFAGLTFAGELNIEDIDLSAISTDKLISLRNDIEIEISNRIEKTSDHIYDGEYVVGKDIAPGRYAYTNLMDEEGATGSLEIRDNETDRTIMYRVTVYGRCIYDLNLEDGNILCINNGDGFIEPYHPSWALD